MPIYEFVCMNCKSELELLVGTGEKPTCPTCDHSKLEKQLSVISTSAGPDTSQPVAANCSQPKC